MWIELASGDFVNLALASEARTLSDGGLSLVLPGGATLFRGTDAQVVRKALGLEARRTADTLASHTG